MKTNSLLILGLALVPAAGVAQTPIPLNTVPSRIVGHSLAETLTVRSANPNLVEGREFYQPQGVALDTSVSPPILYVSDPGNNRVLAWKNALSLANNPKADLVIGQQDPYHTSAQGPGGTFQSGLSAPNGIVVDNQGNLYVTDTGNNRILRYPTPFQQYAQTGNVFPDMWVGQPSLSTSGANYAAASGQPCSDQGLNLAASSLPINIALDGDSNLWVVDAGNRRVLEFTAANLAHAQQSGDFSSLHASLEIGQVDFTSNNLTGPTTSTLNVANAFATPAAIAFDASGNLFVSDYSTSYQLGRVLVFTKPFSSKQSAVRIMGIPNSTAPVGQVAMGLPAAMFFIPSSQMMGVVDSGDSRILLFSSFDSGQWPASVTTSPAATAVLGQTGYTGTGGNGGTGYVPAPSAWTFNHPTAAMYSASGSELYVADTLNNRVLTLPFAAGTFSAANQVLGQLNFTMSAPNMIEGREFNFFSNISGSAADAGVAIDTSSAVPHLYVSDPNNHRVLGFKDFRSLAAGAKADIVIGQNGFNSGLCNMTGNPATPTASSLCYPTGLAVDPQGSLYVADSVNSRVLRFPAPFSYQGTGPEPADLVLGQHQFTFSVSDPTSSTMKYPYGLALADNNGLLVSDLAHNRVLFFPFDSGKDTFAAGTDNGMQATKVFGQPDFSSIGSGNGNTQFNGPHHIAVDNGAYLYVADSGNNRIMIFNQVNGSNTFNGAGALFQITGVSSPRGLWVNPTTSEIWVGDNSSTVKKYPYLASLETENPVTTSGTVNVPGAALAVAQDEFGDLVVADATNRVGFYFPAADAINGGNFLPSCIGGSSTACRPLAPGILASLCSQGSVCSPGSTLPLFGATTAANTGLANPYPMPTVLGDTRVDLSWTNSDGSTTTQSAPLYYVSPTQINFVVPMGAPSNGLVNLSIIQDSTSRVYAAGQAQMAAFSPAILELEYTGNLRQAAVINLADGTVNSTTNPAARGTYISIYATGQGFVPGAPPDGAAVTSPVSAPVPLQVNLNGLYLSQYNYDSSSDIPQSQWLEYSGLSSFPGLWQINLYIPHSVKPGTLIPLIIVTEGEPNTAPGTYITYINVK